MEVLTKNKDYLFVKQKGSHYLLTNTISLTKTLKLQREEV